MFLVPPLPKTGQSGAADVAVVPGWHTTVVALRHRIVPPAATCSVHLAAQTRGGVWSTLVGWSVHVEREELGRHWQERKAKWAERDGFPWPPALLLWRGGREFLREQSRE